MLTILRYPNQILTQVCTPVIEFDTELNQFCDDMHATMKEAKGLGLAANQVGKPIRVITMNIASTLYTLINPIIVSSEGEQERVEGCLSFPGLFVKVNRAEKIIVDFQDNGGYNQSLTAEGLLSVCIQHELDHLNGIVFVDKLSPLKRTRLLKKFAKGKVVRKK